MAKKSLKPQEYLSPVPAVLISSGSGDSANLVAVAWIGTVNSVPPMVSISLMRERHSHKLIAESGEFTVNLIDKDLAWALDRCGMKSGRDVDKWEDAGLTKEPGEMVACPGIAESKVQLECKVVETHSYGTHDMFVGEVVNVRAEEDIVGPRGFLDWSGLELVALCHPGDYFKLEREPFAKMGFSMKEEK